MYWVIFNREGDKVVRISAQDSLDAPDTLCVWTFAGDALEFIRTERVDEELAYAACYTRAGLWLRFRDHYSQIAINCKGNPFEIGDIEPLKQAEPNLMATA